MIKNVVLVFYVLLTGVYLWIFTILAKPEFTLYSYLITTALAYSAGLAYHILTILFSATIEANNRRYWNEMAMWMFFSILTYAVLSLFLKWLVANHNTAFVIALVSMIISHILATKFALRAERIYRQHIHNLAQP